MSCSAPPPPTSSLVNVSAATAVSDPATIGSRGQRQQQRKCKSVV
uniref:Uncharacterized protein n=1 Tax=Arundo donax TaxID=35708 RepID=A0A0A9C8B8_ARUDO